MVLTRCLTQSWRLTSQLSLRKSFIPVQRSQIGSLSHVTRALHKSSALLDIFNVQDEDDFKAKVVNNPKPVIVEFHAQWCGPCKQLMPRMETVIGSLKDEPVDLAKVDIDDLPDIAMEYGVGAVPSVLAIKQGKVVDKFVGLQDEDKIKTFVSSLT